MKYYVNNIIYNLQTVIKNYYQESIKISKSIKSKTSDVIKNVHDAQVALARFADAQFEHVKMYMKSPQFKSLKKCVEYSCSAVKYDSMLQDTDLKRAVIISQKQSTNDAAELQNIEKEKNNYLLIAVRYVQKRKETLHFPYIGMLCMRQTKFSPFSLPLPFLDII